MKLVCSQAELNTALQLVSRAVASRPTHPVLANVLLTADAGTDRLIMLCSVALVIFLMQSGLLQVLSALFIFTSPFDFLLWCLFWSDVSRTG